MQDTLFWKVAIRLRGEGRCVVTYSALTKSGEQVAFGSQETTVKEIANTIKAIQLDPQNYALSPGGMKPQWVDGVDQSQAGS